MHARFGMSALLCLLASSTAIADDTRWQVVNADRIKVGHAQITRTESAPDGSLRRLLREVQTSEGDPRIEARVVGDDLEITRGATLSARLRPPQARHGTNSCSGADGIRAHYVRGRASSGQ